MVIEMRGDGLWSHDRAMRYEVNIGGTENHVLMAFADLDKRVVELWVEMPNKVASAMHRLIQRDVEVRVIAGVAKDGLTREQIESCSNPADPDEEVLVRLDDLIYAMKISHPGLVEKYERMKRELLRRATASFFSSIDN